MSNSKIVVSPFGWGEINVPRDYEVALSGSVLLKPDISHLSTWPDIFNKDTVVQYNWDLSNLLELVEKILDNYDHYIEYAIRPKINISIILLVDWDKRNSVSILKIWLETIYG